MYIFTVLNSVSKIKADLFMQKKLSLKVKKKDVVFVKRSLFFTQNKWFFRHLKNIDILTFSENITLTLKLIQVFKP